MFFHNSNSTKMNILKNSFKLTILIILVFFISKCSETNPIEPEVVGDVFVIDTLEVNIYYDDTPGFKYPLTKHEFKTVIHLTEKGSLHGYHFKCDAGNYNNAIAIDYFQSFEPGFKFRYNFADWSKTILNVNDEIPFSLTLYASLDGYGKIYDYKSSTRVIYSNLGIKPEVNAKQLTGPENRNYFPQFSKDGNYIYYKSSHEKESIFRTDINGNSFEDIEVFDGQSMSNGSFQIIDDTQLAYVLWKPNVHSKIVIKDLQTMANTEYEVNGYLWGSDLIRIPNTNKFLNFLDPNSIDGHDRILLSADIDTKKVDTLLSDIGYIKSYSINPETNNLVILILNNNGNSIFEYSFHDQSLSALFVDIDFLEFKFFKNGIDYAFIKKGENWTDNIYVNINGNLRQITTYPGEIHDFDISPDGTKIVFSARRRNEIQSWIIEL